jgi:hypothetical protein
MVLRRQAAKAPRDHPTILECTRADPTDHLPVDQVQLPRSIHYYRTVAAILEQDMMEDQSLVLREDLLKVMVHPGDIHILVIDLR